MDLINLALNKTVSCSSFIAPYNPLFAVDALAAANHRWVCNKLPCWLMVDLGTITDINQWKLVHMGGLGDANWPTSQFCLEQFQLEGSNDGINWNVLDRISKNTEGINNRRIVDVKYRYFRVYIEKGHAVTNAASIVQFELYNNSEKVHQAESERSNKMKNVIIYQVPLLNGQRIHIDDAFYQDAITVQLEDGMINKVSIVNENGEKVQYILTVEKIDWPDGNF